MQRKVLLTLITVVFLLSFLLAGCQGGIPQEQYDQVLTQIKEVQAKIAEAQSEAQSLQAE